MSSPVVVQGVSVPQPQPVAGHAQGAINESPKKGCNDPIFAALFYVAVIGIAAVAFIYGPGAFEDANDANDANEGEIGSYDGYIYAVLVTGVISLVVSGLGLWVLMKIPEFLIKAALLFSVVMSGLVAVAALLSGSFGGAIVGLVFFAIGVCYAYAVWSRIPFATANLVTSITAVKANLGVAGISYVFAILGMGWTVLWSIAVLGVYESVYSCDAEGNCSVDSAGLLFLLFVAFYFVHQVFQVGPAVRYFQIVGTITYASSRMFADSVVLYRILYTQLWRVSLVHGGLPRMRVVFVEVPLSIVSSGERSWMDLDLVVVFVQPSCLCGVCETNGKPCVLKIATTQNRDNVVWKYLLWSKSLLLITSFEVL